jgi:2-keto-4-pentenoate hydratase/2-oxohepta-3-ene-1,7-dioic acid hydratase in catechol pathway
MRLANHDGAPALVEGDRVRVIAGGAAGPAAGPSAFIDVIASWSETGRPPVCGGPLPFDPARLGPPVPVPGKILGAPVNYASHQREMNVEHTIAGLGFFLKSPSSIIGPDGVVPVPFAQRRTDQEAELGVVIGRRAANVALGDALDHVFGYTCLVDVTVRGPEERSTRKSFPGFTPIGPWIITAEEIPDPNDLRLRGWVNDELRQDASTSAMVYSVAQLIELMSSVVTLEPGDVIATGTPAGVGPVVPGDRIRVDIERIGTLEVPVVAGTREPHPLWHTRASS